LNHVDSLIDEVQHNASISTSLDSSPYEEDTGDDVTNEQFRRKTYKIPTVLVSGYQLREVGYEEYDVADVQQISYA
jgi:hypothetical protein